MKQNRSMEKSKSSLKLCKNVPVLINYPFLCPSLIHIIFYSTFQKWQYYTLKHTKGQVRSSDSQNNQLPRYQGQPSFIVTLLNAPHTLQSHLSSFYS